ncbi:hypothetical protein X744_31855 [Mesorhizobium sp. LNJC372A00]|nr:hypothetical protein X745_32030 [Mesorhizobium sp. LNJC374B00]ESY50947.1 hypothetical protein X744_31855 [Mesorhizobium sp. LNJC372A00]
MVQFGQLRLHFSYQHPHQFIETIVAAPRNISKGPAQPWDVAGNDPSMLG